MKRRRKKSIEIDCLAVKRRGQLKIVAATEGMSPKAEVAYLERRAANGPFQELRKRIRKSATRVRAPKGRSRGI